MIERAFEQPAASDVGPPEAPCPICGRSEGFASFARQGLSLTKCSGCGLVSLAGLSQSNSSPTGPDSRIEGGSALGYLSTLCDRGLGEGRILLVAPPGHQFAEEAQAQGFEIGSHVSVLDVEDGREGLGEGYDAAVVLYQLEKAAAPLELLQRLRAAVRPEGILLLATPSLDSWPARLLGQRWSGWRARNRLYFDKSTIHSFLWKTGFAAVWVEPDCGSNALTPFSSSGMIATARRAERRERPLLSIVLPVYNERPTFPTLMEIVLAKQVPGMDKEVIVVESNSPDGTREVALQYQGHPEVKLVLEDRRRGKGYAVRAGLKRAEGDIVLIQDADLEYDVEDYDALVEPLLCYRQAFILGSRYAGDWKMRKFDDQPGIAAAANIAHLFFTTLLNVLYRQRMKDPLTMYKVFRRDCLYGLQFECNEFDYDHELLIKLIRKGYNPIELPVSYRSRSFKEGKKTRPLHDPWTWLWADFKYRFIRLSRPRGRLRNDYHS